MLHEMVYIRFISAEDRDSYGRPAYRQISFQLTCNLLQLPRMSRRKRNQIANVTIKTKYLNRQIDHHSYIKCLLL